MMCLPNALSTACAYVLVLQVETGVKHVNHDDGQLKKLCYLRLHTTE